MMQIHEWGLRAVAGMITGATWNLANLWCLRQLLTTWLGSKQSTPRVVAWLAVKFPLLYLAAWWLLSRPAISLIGFGIGFTMVLIVMISFQALHATHRSTPVSHER